MIEQLGPYRIIRMVGRGGMGTVYEGVHDETGQRAAVKALPLVLADEGNFRERFIGEIETLKQLKHPNIVQLYGDGEQEGLLFYAMELVEGRTLQEELQAKHEFRWPEVLRIGIEMCQALQHAHAHGIIHRDLKPANLLRTQDRQIKLLDFGIAKLFGATHLTADGSVVGTADYMAPEQAEGRPVSNRTDLFSLGAVMFTLLTRRPPFSGGSIPEVLHRLRYDDAPLVRRYVGSVPAELEEIIDQLLKKEPKDRLPTALVVANRLKAMEHGLSATTVVERPTVTNIPRSVSPNDQITRESNVAASPPTEVSPTSVEPRASDVPADAYSWNDATIVTPGAPSAEVSAAASSSQTVADSSDSSSGRNRFTTIEQQRSQADRSAAMGFVDRAKTAGLVVGLLALVGFVAWAFWHSLQPNPMYDAIRNQLNKPNAPPPTRKIENFLQWYPDDPRCDELRSSLLEIQSQSLLSRLVIRARKQALTEVQQAYVDAMRLTNSEPPQTAEALDRFEQLIADFADAPDEADPISCVEAARHQVQRLRAAASGDNRTTAGPYVDRNASTQLASSETLAEKRSRVAQARWRR